MLFGRNKLILSHVEWGFEHFTQSESNENLMRFWIRLRKRCDKAYEEENERRQSNLTIKREKSEEMEIISGQGTLFIILWVTIHD